MADITGGMPCSECGGTEWDINDDREFVTCCSCGHSSEEDQDFDDGGTLEVVCDSCSWEGPMNDLADNGFESVCPQCFIVIEG